MDTMAGRLVERPGAHAVRARPFVRAREDAADGVGQLVHEVQERWSPARPGSGEPGQAQSRPPGRSPAQPLDSPLATGPSGGTRRLEDRGPVEETGRGEGIGSTWRSA
jgi:hypothetical protein